MSLGLLLSPTVFAGDWKTGQGETIHEAIESAIKVAESYVKSRGKGCVDGRQRGLKKKNIGGTTVWEIQVYVHNQNGSCGIDANAAWAKSVAADLAKAYAGKK